MTKINTIRAAQTGTYSIQDLRANYMSLYEFGLDNALALVTTQLAAYNSLMNDSLKALATFTTERTEINPLTVDASMTRVDEYGDVRTEKAGRTVGRAFPLDKFQRATGWTDDFYLSASVSDLVVMGETAQLAHTQAIRSALAYALYTPVQREVQEYVTSAVGYQIISGQFVKPLFNADGEVPTVSPTGEVFDGTHNHYLATTSLTAQALEELELTVGEHSVDNNLEIYVNVADASAVRALPGFVAATIQQVVNPVTGAVTTTNLDVSRTDNKFIGYTAGGIPVYTKPWDIKGYAICVNLNGPRALKMRMSPVAAQRGLRIKGIETETVFSTKTWEAMFGFGVSNRGAAAVLQFNSPDGLYHAPKISGYVTVV